MAINEVKLTPAQLLKKFGKDKNTKFQNKYVDDLINGSEAEDAYRQHAFTHVTYNRYNRR